MYLFIYCKKFQSLVMHSTCMKKKKKKEKKKKKKMLRTNGFLIVLFSVDRLLLIVWC